MCALLEPTRQALWAQTAERRSATRGSVPIPKRRLGELMKLQADTVGLNKGAAQPGTKRVDCAIVR